ncbi:MAG: hypothetical protein R6T87_02560, partial [Marinobacter sp.]
LPNPTSVGSVSELRTLVGSGVDGQTLLSTIFKFEGSTTAIPNSDRWIVMVDECHMGVDQPWYYHMAGQVDDSVSLVRAFFHWANGFNPVVPNQDKSVVYLTLVIVHGGDNTGVLQ